jgi:peptidyl-prolyl cis-trans isomerase B (cyclophilin B)
MSPKVGRNVAKDTRLESFKAKQAIVAGREVNRHKDNKRALLAGAIAIVIASASQLLYFNFGPGKPADPLSTATEFTFKINGQDITAALSPTFAPIAVDNLVDLVQDGFYEGLSCHRLVTAGIFVLQCGDPNGDGSGGPGYSWGPIENAPTNDLYTAGAIAMARQPNVGDSMGSQFFIVYEDSTIPSDSAGGYTILGRITSGLEVIQEIAAGGVASGTSDGPPSEEVTLSELAVK